MTVHKDYLGYKVIVENNTTCPVCQYEHATSLRPVEGKGFLAWCPCSTIFNVTSIFERGEFLPEWWTEKP